MGRVRVGAIPPNAEYSVSFPFGIAIPPDALVAEPQNALAVGHHRDINVVVDCSELCGYRISVPV